MTNVRLQARTASSDIIFDDEWIKSTFIITEQDIITGSVGQKNQYETFIRNNRYSTSADHKFSSTSPGMSLGVNPKPQFTRYCDIRSKGRLTNRPDITPDVTFSQSGLGMGGYYSTAIDDNEQRVFFRFGVPSYMTLPIWIAKCFDINRAVLQGRGTITSDFLSVIDVASKFFTFVSSPGAALLSIALVAVKTLTSDSRFYSIRPTMYTYWSTVQNTLNSLVARRTMLPHIFKDYTYKLDPVVGTPTAVSQTFINNLNAYIPDIVSETGRISIFAIALRNQAFFNRIKLKELRQNETRSTINSANSSDDISNNNLVGNPDLTLTPNLSFASATNTKGDLVNTLFKRASEFLPGGPNSDTVSGLDEESSGIGSTISYNSIYLDANNKPLAITLDKDNPADSLEAQLASNVNAKASGIEKYGEYLMAELSEGAAFAVFNVEATGSVGESFTSSFGTNPIESSFNSLSAKARNLGSLLSSATEVPIVGDAVKLAADAGALIISNSTFGFANPLLALAYGVNVSMPKIWESSGASLPTSNYKIRLISPYGNAYSQLFNIYMPLAMILAASLPRSTGNSSYVSPFFCQTFDRGRNNIHIGMVSNVSITRGTSNLAFTRAGHPNAIDVEMSVANMDEIVALDVSSAGVIGKAVQAFNPDFSETPFTAYMNTIAAVDVYTVAFRIPKLRLKMAERYMDIKAVVNPDPAAFAAMTVNTIPGLGIARNILGDPSSALQSLNTY